MNISFKSVCKRNNILLLVMATAACFGYYFYHVTRPCNGIVEYSLKRDYEPLLKLFKDNWYWLVPENSTFSAERFLKDNAPKRAKPAQGNNSTIMVYCDQGKPVGLVSYHMESFYKGRLRFIVVDKDYRGKGISLHLFNYAINQLKKSGATMVTIFTRTDNEAARKLYDGQGFKAIIHDDRFMTFEKSI